MNIDMSTVKAITHNNKDVKKIEDSNGNILWQAADWQYTVYDDENHFLCAPKTGTYGTGIETQPWSYSTADKDLYIIFKFDNTADINYNKVFGGSAVGTAGTSNLELNPSSSTGGFRWRHNYSSNVSASQTSISYEASNTSSTKWTPNVKKYLAARKYVSGSTTYTRYRQKSGSISWSSWTNTTYVSSTDSSNIWLFTYGSSTTTTGNGVKIALFALGDDRWWPCKRTKGNIVEVGMCHMRSGAVIDQWVPLKTKVGTTDGSNYFWIEDDSGNVVATPTTGSSYSYTLYDDGQHYLCSPLTGEYNTGFETINAEQPDSIVFKFDNSGRISQNNVFGTTKTSNTYGSGYYWLALEYDSDNPSQAPFTLASKYCTSGDKMSIPYEATATSGYKWTPNVRKEIKWTRHNIYTLGNLSQVNLTISQKNGSTDYSSSRDSWSGSVWNNNIDSNNFWLFRCATGSSLVGSTKTGNGIKIASFTISGYTYYPSKRSDGAVGMGIKDSNGNIIRSWLPLTTPTGGTDGSSLFWIEDESGNIM